MAKEEANQELAIMKYRDEIVSKVNKNAITLIFGGETGCGKSTKIPQFVMDACKKENCNILVTQPKKIAVMTLAKRVAWERKCELGKEVGFQISLMKKVDKINRETKLLFCTTGVLLEKIIYSKTIEHYTHIILDEIHERNLDTDLLMTVIREFLLVGNTDTKLILMSATLNLNKFRDYFTLNINEREYEPAVVTIQSERKYEIDIDFLDELRMIQMTDKIVNYSLPTITTELYHLSSKLIKVHLQESSKSILVFLPGIYEIQSLHSILLQYEGIKDKCLVIVMHSSLPTEQQKEAFMRSSLPKVILSTNIAESSVTIPDVECVIDFCLTKNLVCEGSSISALKLEFASNNSCIQRAGRTGRVCDGKVYRLITRRFYDQRLLEENIPEMQRAPLESVILRVKLLEIESPVVFLSKCISSPEKESIRKAVLKLKELGGLRLYSDYCTFTAYDGSLTYVGKIMANLPLDVQLSKLIVVGYMFSILDDIVIIAAGLNIKNIFKTNYNNKLQDFIEKTRWANGSGCDAIAMLNAYKFWQHEREKGKISNYEDEQIFCNEYGLDRKNLHEMRLLIMKIHERLKDLKLEALTGENAVKWSVQEKSLMIKICLAGAFLPNLFIKGKSDNITEREVYKSLIGSDCNNTVYFRKMDRDQLGLVYCDRIKDKLVQYGITDSKNNIKISFDSTKVFVQFIDRKSMVDDEQYNENKLRSNSLFPGNICNQVYRAVKFRKSGARTKMIEMKHNIRENGGFSNSSFDIEVLSVAETREYANKHGILEIVNGIYQTKKILCIDPQHIYLPSYNTKQMVGFVRHIEHCNKFYFEPLYEDNCGILTNLEASLRRESLLEARNIKIDKLVVVYHEEFYKRAKIVKIYDCSTNCYLFDYGSTVEIKFEDIYELDEESMKSYFLIYERCFECRLQEIAPSYEKCPRGKWTKDAINDLSKKVLNNFCKISIYSVVQEIAAVELFLAGENMNEYLMSQGYARKVKEPYASRINHNERENVQSSLTAWIPLEEEFKDKESNIMKISIPSPRLEQCKKIIRLDGPYSPLETDIWEITLKNRGQIQVDPQSVNSVVLDDEVENEHGTLLVAVDVMKNANRGLTLYNVSTMPNIFALPCIVSMMFSTNIIFYPDDNNEKFVGMRFGLGYNEKTFEAFNFEHDCYLPINYEEFMEDVNDINCVRYSMSSLLSNRSEAPELTDDEKITLMNNIKTNVIKILAKKRTPTVNPTFFPDRNPSWKTKSDVMPNIEDPHTAGPYRSMQLPFL